MFERTDQMVARTSGCWPVGTDGVKRVSALRWRWRRASALVGLGLASFFGSAALADAQVLAPRGADLLSVAQIPWLVAPMPEPEAKHWVGKKFMIAPTRLVAKRSVRLLGEFTHPAFKDLKVGTAANLAVTNEPMFTACVATRYEVGPGNLDLPCFVDSDQDGKFDKVFELRMNGDVQIIPFRLPKKDKIFPIAPIGYRELGKDEVGATAWAYLHVDEFNSKALFANVLDSIRMQVVVVSKTNAEKTAHDSFFAMNELLKVPAPKTGPVDFEFLGATYTISDFWIHGNPALPWQADGPGGVNIERKQPAPGGDLLPLLERTYAVLNGRKG